MDRQSKIALKGYWFRCYLLVRRILWFATTVAHCTTLDTLAELFVYVMLHTPEAPLRIWNTIIMGTEVQCNDANALQMLFRKESLIWCHTMKGLISRPTYYTSRHAPCRGVFSHSKCGVPFQEFHLIHLLNRLSTAYVGEHAMPCRAKGYAIRKQNGKEDLTAAKVAVLGATAIFCCNLLLLTRADTFTRLDLKANENDWCLISGTPVTFCYNYAYKQAKLMVETVPSSMQSKAVDLKIGISWDNTCMQTISLRRYVSTQERITVYRTKRLSCNSRPWEIKGGIEIKAWGVLTLAF